VALEVVTYEGYAHGGVAVLVEALTDNRNRTASEVRSIFTKHGGHFGEAGSVAWMFDKKGQILVNREAATEDDLMLTALEGGAEDVRTAEDTYEITTAPEDLYRVRQALEAGTIPFVSAEVTMVPRTTVRLEGKEARQVLRLIEALEEHDDVQQAYANFDIPEELLQQVG
jgi:YebC/PmpR family DNA-binding regulatory protein